MSTTTSATSTTPMQLTGLASGLDTSSIITQLMAIERMPEKQMQVKKSQSEARQSLLKDFDTKLNALHDAAAALSAVTLWSPKQTVTSSDPARVSAVLTSLIRTLLVLAMVENPMRSLRTEILRGTIAAADHLSSD